jgi:hypothetical protein
VSSKVCFSSYARAVLKAGGNEHADRRKSATHIARRSTGAGAKLRFLCVFLYVSLQAPLPFQGPFNEIREEAR